MRRTPIIAAAIGSLFVASSSFAAFTFTYQVSATPFGTYTNPATGTAGPAPVANGTPLYTVDVYALNNGGGSGVGVKAIEMRGSGLPTLWTTNTGGTPIGNNYNSVSGEKLNPDRSYVTAEDVNDGDTGFLTETWAQLSSNGYTPTGSWGNQGSGGVRTGSVNPWTITGNANAPVADATLNGGKGLLVGHLVVAGTGAYSLTTLIGGSEGTKTEATTSLNIGGGTTTPPTNANPVIAPVAPATVNFGPIVSNGAPFSVNVIVTDANAADVLALATTAVAGITNVTVTGGGTSPQTFVVQGTVNYSLNGTTVIVPITATDGAGGSTTGSFSIIVTPEPASLSLIGLGGLLLGRRRK